MNNSPEAERNVRISATKKKRRTFALLKADRRRSMDVGAALRGLRSSKEKNARDEGLAPFSLPPRTASSSSSQLDQLGKATLMESDLLQGKETDDSRQSTTEEDGKAGERSAPPVTRARRESDGAINGVEPVDIILALGNPEQEDATSPAALKGLSNNRPRGRDLFRKYFTIDEKEGTITTFQDKATQGKLKGSRESSADGGRSQQETAGSKRGGRTGTKDSKDRSGTSKGVNGKRGHKSRGSDTILLDQRKSVIEEVGGGSRWKGGSRSSGEGHGDVILDAVAGHRVESDSDSDSSGATNPKQGAKQFGSRIRVGTFGVAPPVSRLAPRSASDASPIIVGEEKQLNGADAQTGLEGVGSSESNNNNNKRGAGDVQVIVTRDKGQG